MADITQRSELFTEAENWLGRTDLTTRLDIALRLTEDRMSLDTRLHVRDIENYFDLQIDKPLDGETVGGSANAITLTILFYCRVVKYRCCHTEYLRRWCNGFTKRN
jgi:hypothetical protein